MINKESILSITRKFENIILVVILVVFSLLLTLSLVDIVYEIVKDILSPPVFIIKADNLMNLFSVFLVVLIGLELLETIKAYLKEDVLHVELVLLLAIIAISRKVIVWDFEKYNHQQLVGLAIMIFSLSLSYFLLKAKMPRFKSKKDGQKIT